ncbi:MAG: hypothetical protein J5U17_03890 [Candidatus Methanoperedens sp.]|nr:hypothetical protein [Candidatus Methanoperedens sp.]MCE8424902.1 hypothetical protein [Candidatus Methanoperedens sp.]MCE8428110.1 hypothetical protein [Candidatus Methanoperedens sp.]
MGNYENTLSEIEKTWGTVPDFMKAFTRESLVNDWPSWKKEKLSEIDMERASYLLNIDEITGETLGGPQKVPEKTMMELNVSIMEELTDGTAGMEGDAHRIEKNHSLPGPELIRDRPSFDQRPAFPREKNRDRPFLKN